MNLWPHVDAKSFGDCKPGELVWSPYQPYELCAVVKAANADQSFLLPLDPTKPKFMNLLGCRNESGVGSLGLNSMFELDIEGFVPDAWRVWERRGCVIITPGQRLLCVVSPQVFRGAEYVDLETGTLGSSPRSQHDLFGFSHWRIFIAGPAHDGRTEIAHFKDDNLPD
jgi:hypothetical protein